MIRHHLRTTLRLFRREKSYVFINVVGLAVGIASCLFIGRYLQHEWSHDRFHEKAERTFRLVNIDVAEGRSSNVIAAPVGPMVAESFPEIESVVRLATGWPTVMVRADQAQAFEKDFYFVERGFFDVFDFEMLSGDPATALAAPFSIVLPQRTAERYFGPENPMGQTLTVNDVYEFTVTGVMQDPPSNTHLKLPFLASYETLRSIPNRSPDDFGMGSFTYLVLADGVDPIGLQTGLASFAAEHINPNLFQPITPFLQSLTDIHLFPQDDFGDISPPGDPRYLALFAVVGLLILVIACINYANLATARAVPRAREIGVRKVVGALRSQLVLQFWTEALTLTIGSIAGGWLLFDMMLPVVNTAMGLSLSPISIGLGHIGLMGGAAVFIALIAGAYPTLYLASLDPSRALKGTRIGGKDRRLTGGLVAFQFCVTLMLIASTLVIGRQLAFIQHRDVGFDTDRVMVVSARHSVVNERPERFESLKQALLERVAVERVSMAAAMPATGYQGGGSLSVPGSAADEFFFVDSFEGDVDFVETLGMELVAGRGFDGARTDDFERAMIVNEAAVRELGVEDAIGMELDFVGERRTIVGVVRDFHHRSMHEVVRPSVLIPRPVAAPDNFFVGVRLGGGDLDEGISAVRDTWTALAPDLPFHYTFVDRNLEAFYRADARFSRIFQAFSLVGILISCFGLFGLASFTIARRTKEIGIRKVLGASSAGILGLLSLEYLKLVGIGFIVAVPVVWFGMNRWLEGFAYRADIAWWIFALAGLLVVVVAGATVAIRAMKTVLADPVQSLRYE